jgi:hypothetical protein
MKPLEFPRRGDPIRADWAKDQAEGIRFASVESAQHCRMHQTVTGTHISSQPAFRRHLAIQESDWELVGRSWKCTAKEAFGYHVAANQVPEGVTNDAPYPRVPDNLLLVRTYSAPCTRPGDVFFVTWNASAGCWMLDQNDLQAYVLITSNTPGSDGMFPGIVQAYDPVLDEWFDLYECRVRDVNA